MGTLPFGSRRYSPPARPGQATRAAGAGYPSRAGRPRSCPQPHRRKPAGVIGPVPSRITPLFGIRVTTLSVNTGEPTFGW